jgi:acetyl/propionyl-CoA carboxylase alpha subunit
VLGIRTNIAFLLQILRHPRFVAGDIDTGWLDREGGDLRDATVVEPDARVARIVDAAQQHRGAGPADAVADPWQSLRGVRV